MSVIVAAVYRPASIHSHRCKLCYTIESDSRNKSKRSLIKPLLYTNIDHNPGVPTGCLVLEHLIRCFHSPTLFELSPDVQ